MTPAHEKIVADAMEQAITALQRMRRLGNELDSADRARLAGILDGIGRRARDYAVDADLCGPKKPSACAAPPWLKNG